MRFCYKDIVPQDIDMLKIKEGQLVPEMTVLSGLCYYAK